MNLSSHFPRYEDHNPVVPIWCVTPNTSGNFHRFFDTSPISPSGHYLACLRLPFEDRLPRPGEFAAVVVIDLHNGEERIVAQTMGWETQTGANINWGASDEELFFNDVDPDIWRPVTVKLNPHTGATERFGRGIYHVSPDGQWALTASLEKMRRTQIGYGVTVPTGYVPVNWELSDDDGLFLTSLETGECRLLVSLRELIENYIPEREKPAIASRCYYGFHAKWSPTGEHLLFTVRAVAHPWALHFDTIGSPLHFYIFTMRPDGTDIKCATDATFWTRQGHHINFHPDGQSLTMNHVLDFDHLRFVTCGLDGSNKRILVDNTLGSGHPTVHANGRNILTDTYLNEPMAFGDGTIPLRWLDIDSGKEWTVARIKTAETSGIPALRVDPHPAWDRTWRYVTFNAVVAGTRRVFVADFANLI